MSLKTFERGIHPSYNKDITSAGRVETLPAPKIAVIALSQHIGAPCEPVVKKGDAVVEGQLVGEASGFVSAPVHASISGKVKDIVKYRHPGGSMPLSIIIEGDGAPAKEWASAATDAALLKPEYIRLAIRNAGIVGLGGASFPTSVKLSPPKDKNIDAVILNGCECEPYLTADHRIMVEEPEKVVMGLKAIMIAVGAKDGYIGIEDNKMDAVKALEGAAAKALPGLKIALLETKYPQGAEKMLIKAVLGRKVPIGKLPMDVGVVVNNVGTAVAVSEAISSGKPLIERVVTVSGNAIASPKNLKVRIGTLFEELANYCGGIKQGGGEVVVLNGGPMMGISQKTLDVPVVKGTSGITVLSGDEIKPRQYGPCIRCARCVEACPMALMPYKLGDMGRLSMTQDFKSWAGVSCIECGCCSFVCPAKRPLVQWIRVGKIKLREAEKGSAA